jgi:hypothetical protein
VLGNPQPDSALMRELNPEAWTWASTAKTNTILADIWDMLAQINANLIAAATQKPARKFKPYPRPAGKKNEPEDQQHYGSGALPADELRKWFEEKRRMHNAGSGTGNHIGNPDP